MPSKKQRLKQIQGAWTASEMSVQYKPGIVYEHPINSTYDAYTLALGIWDKERINIQEEFMAFFIDYNTKTIGHRLIATGRGQAVNVDIRLIACLALHTLAASVIVAHNHPSGILQPSDADIILTKKLKKALQLIDVKLLDHLIISESSYVSIMQKDLI